MVLTKAFFSWARSRSHEMKPSVRGVQELELNEENTSLSFHAFVESNNKLRDHHSLEIKVDAASDIVFEKP